MSRTFEQRLVGLFGHPVAGNPTQPMIEAAFADNGLDWRYLTIDVAPDALDAAVAGARAMGFAGFHCTIPHKVAVVELVDEVAASAALIGAVNCVVAREGRLVGENTDGRGFLRSLSGLADPAGLDVVLLGAGGAARAIAVELALAGVKRLTIVNRSARRLSALAGHLEDRVRPRVGGLGIEAVVWDGVYAVPAAADLVVNATSIGLPPRADADVPVDIGALGAAAVVADVIPAAQTPFLRRAQQHGARTLDGLGMLVEQGRISVEAWAGVEPDAAVMRAALVEASEAA
jgi:shikimate dehydrogenase